MFTQFPTRARVRPCPHTEREALFGCIDGRLILAHARQAIQVGRHGHSTMFLTRMAGGAAALLTRRDATSAMGQLTDAHGVKPFNNIKLQLHEGCGKLARDDIAHELSILLGEQFDPASINHLYRLGDLAAERVVQTFRDELAADVRVTVQVLAIGLSWYGLPTTRIREAA